MGSIPASALDPIFYAHHTNIDRLYDCWLQVDPSGRLPNDPGQRDTTFSFVDADGSMVTRRVGDMLTTAQLGYSYASGGGCPARPIAAAAAVRTASVAATERVLASASQTRLSGAQTSVPLTVSEPGRKAFAARPGAAPTARVDAVIDGLQYENAPGALYNVYLQGAGGQRVLIGVINFFGLAPARASEHADQSRRSFRFDVTDALRQLNLSAGAAPSLVFEATTGLAESTPDAVAATLNAQANVRFESARLVGKP
jgi:hypothetical protein